MYENKLTGFLRSAYNYNNDIINLYNTIIKDEKLLQFIIS